MPALSNTEAFIKLINKKFPNKFDLFSIRYQKCDVPVEIICLKHGIFKQTPSRFLSSSYGCPSCNPKHRLTTKEFIRLSQRKHGINIYDYSKVNYINAVTKVEIICPKHGNFWQKPQCHYDFGQGCLKCFKENERVTKNEIINRLEEKHGKLPYNFDTLIFTKMTEPITIECQLHGVFSRRMSEMLSGCKPCPKCAELEFLEQRKNKFLQRAKEKHGGKAFDFSKVKYVGMYTGVEIICPKHGSFLIKPVNFLANRGGCPICAISIGEERISKILQETNIKFIHQKRFPSCRNKYTLPFDFYLPEYNVCIEYDGEQHFREVFGEKSFERTKHHDSIKNQYCKNNKIKLFRIPYNKNLQDELDNILNTIRSS